MRRGRRRYRKNPDTMTWLLLLGGGAAAYYFFVHKKKGVTVLPAAAPGAPAVPELSWSERLERMMLREGAARADDPCAGTPGNYVCNTRACMVARVRGACV